MPDRNLKEYWREFFRAAGILDEAADEYTDIFCRNRVRATTLSELNKDYLKDMSITLTGDIMAIIKHAKEITKTEEKPESSKDGRPGELVFTTAFMESLLNEMKELNMKYSKLFVGQCANVISAELEKYNGEELRNFVAEVGMTDEQYNLLRKEFTELNVQRRNPAHPGGKQLKNFLAHDVKKALMVLEKDDSVF